MAKIITLFNHKGGVGKTTLSYNIAWELSEQGKRVLMIDADPQCNLTEITQAKPDFVSKCNVYEYFRGYVEPQPGEELPETLTFNKRENLELLPGSLRFAELEDTISISLNSLSGFARNVPMNMYNAIKRISEGFDFVIVDLSPALSGINQLFLMLSDYFIMPVSPSIFSEQALSNVEKVFKKWNGNIARHLTFEKPLPQLLGIVCQNFRPYNMTSSTSFEEAMKSLNEKATSLANNLNAYAMAITPNEFTNLFDDSFPYRIANISDFNKLSILSEQEGIPVVGFDEKILRKHDVNTQHYQTKLIEHKKEFATIVNGLIKL